MKRKLFITVIVVFLLLAIPLVAFYFYSLKFDSVVSRLDKAKVLAVKKPDLPPDIWSIQQSSSRLVIPALIPMHVLLQKIEDKVELRMEGVEDDPLGKFLKDDSLYWWLERDKFHIKAVNESIDLSVLLNGQARLTGKVLIPKISSSLNLNATLAIQMQPILTENWRVNPQWTGDVDAHKATTRILRKEISLRSFFNKKANKAYQRALDKKAKKLMLSDKIEKKMQKQWQKLYRIKKISDSPLAWSMMQPLDLAVEQMQISDQGLRFGLDLTMDTRIVVADNQPKLHRKPLPKARFIDIKKPELTLNVVVMSQLSVLSKSLRKKFVGQVFAKDGLTVDVLDIHIEGADDRLLIGVDILGSYNGLRNQAQLYLWADPLLEGNQLIAKNIEYDIHSENILIEHFNWLVKEQLKDRLQQALEIDLKDKLDDAKLRADTSLQELLADLSSESTLAGHVSKISVEKLSIYQNNLYIALRAESRLSGEMIFDKL